MLTTARNLDSNREIFLIDLDVLHSDGDAEERVAAPISSAPIETHKRRAWAWYFLMLTPALLAAVYAFGYANDRFQTEARFVIRSSGAAESVNGLGLGVQQILGGPARDEGHVVKDFILSRDALRYLSERMPIREMLQPPEWDPLFQFPGLFSNATQEGAFKHYLRFVRATFQADGGVLILRVEAFSPADAATIATALAEAAEELVNRLNRRPSATMVAAALVEVERSRDRAFQAQEALTAWRTQERMVDPTRMASVYVETIARLVLELAQLRAQISEIQNSAPRSPQLTSLRARATSLAEQVEIERRALVGGDTGFADLLGAYERLALERTFAERSFESALNGLELARRDTEQHKLFVEQIVQARQADWPLYPKRWLIVAVAFLFNISLLVILRALFLDTKSHVKS